MRNMSEDKQKIIGRNAVLEALKSGRPMERILVAKGTEGSIKKIVGEARERRIPLRFCERRELEAAAGGGTHQGVVAYASAREYASVEDILALAEERGEDPFVIILDGLEDPHNLGAVMRTAECAGAHGVIIGKRRSAGLTETVAKASAGAVEYIPCARVPNIPQVMDVLKENGLWVACCDMGDRLYYKADLTGPIALVIGGEGSGVGRLVKEKCDFVVSIPMAGKINSLNASNAAAVLMYEVRRQRDGTGF